MYFNLKNDDQISSAIPAVTIVASAPQINPGASSQQYTVSNFRNCRDNQPRAETHTWASFCTEFKKHPERREKDGPAWSPVSFTPNGTRKNEFVDQVYFAVIDVDSGLPHQELMDRFKGFAYLVHSSYSHSPTLSKYRMILPLAEPVSATNWRLVWARINHMAGGCNDPATKDEARLYYKPAHPVGDTSHFTEIGEGRMLSLTDLPELETPAASRPLTFQRTVNFGRLPEIEGIESSGPDLNFEQGLTHVVKRCAFMEFASRPENQDGLSEPLWMAMITNACRFENSEAWIHEASKHHSEYDEGETSSRIERFRNNGGPVTCERIRELDFQGCPSGGCARPNGQLTKSPAGLYGWMFKQQLSAATAAQATAFESYEVGSFTVNEGGVFQNSVKNDEPVSTKLCSRIDITAQTRDHDSNNWGIELSFADPDGKAKRWAMPKEMLGSASEAFRNSLLRMGASLEPSKAAREGLAAYLMTAAPEARALSVGQPGWSNGVFVLPDQAYGQAAERIVFQTTVPEDIKRFATAGTLESWQQNVALPCVGNSRAALAICIGLAPPLLALLGEDNGGFHLRGNSSSGKTVCLAIGSSVWGGSNLIRTWNMTVNGLEGIAVMHNDVLLPLDELGQADGKAASEAAYLLGNGQGKSRADKSGEGRAVKRFRNLVLSSGEKSMADMMTQAGQSAMAGQEVRMVDISADAGAGYGVFENIHGARSSQLFAEGLKRAVAEHHGHAGRAFVEVLANAELQPKLVETIRAAIQRFVDTYVPIDASGQVGRVGRRFGLIAGAGELCIELGILPWPAGEATEAARKCFTVWIDQRGGMGNQEEAKTIAQVRRFIELHGESRFTCWTEGIENNTTGKTINRAGFRRITDDDRTEYFILPEAYRTEICQGMNPGAVTKILLAHGLLETSSAGKPQIDKRLPGTGKTKVYHLRADIMGQSVAQIEKEETDGRQHFATGIPMKYNL